MNYLLIIGAKSDIAKEIARVYAENNFNLYLAARETESLKDFAKDITMRNNVKVELKKMDITNFISHKRFYLSLNPKPIGVAVVAGYMAEQKECESDWGKTINTVNVNYTGAVSILNIITNDMEKNKKGFIIGISSVAGDRGRKTNYIYGSSKAGFTAYLSGIRNRLFNSGVKVLTVKPGFVYTKMTEALDLPALLTAKPHEVARNIFKAQQKGEDVLYTKKVWKIIMGIISHIPEIIFKRMGL